MLVLLNWLAVLMLLALWSLAAWLMHGVTVWAIANAGALSEAAGAASVALPVWLTVWMPPEFVQAVTVTVQALRPVVADLLQAMPSLAGMVTVLGWGLWGFGALCLVVLGAVGHVLIHVWRRRSGRRAALAQPVHAG